MQEVEGFGSGEGALATSSPLPMQGAYESCHQSVCPHSNLPTFMRAGSSRSYAHYSQHRRMHKTSLLAFQARQRNARMPLSVGWEETRLTRLRSRALHNRIRDKFHSILWTVRRLACGWTSRPGWWCISRCRTTTGSKARLLSRSSLVPLRAA